MWPGKIKKSLAEETAWCYNYKGKKKKGGGNKFLITSPFECKYWVGSWLLKKGSSYSYDAAVAECLWVPC